MAFFAALGGFVGSFFTPVGAFIGSAIGYVIDSVLFAPDSSDVRQVGSRLGDQKVRGVEPGTAIWRNWGRNRIPGFTIDSSGVQESVTETTEEGEKKQPDVTTVTYNYHVSISDAVCLGPQFQVNTIWFNEKKRFERGTASDSSTVVSPWDPGDFQNPVGNKQEILFAGATFYSGGDLQTPSATFEAVHDPDPVPAYVNIARVDYTNINLADFDNRVPNFFYEVQSHDTPNGDIPIAVILHDIFVDSGLSTDEFHIDCNLTTVVQGFFTSRGTTAMDAVAILRRLFDFDVVETGYKLVVRPRDRDPDAVVFEEDFMSYETGTTPPDQEEFERSGEVEVPREMVLHYSDVGREFQENAVRIRRQQIDNDASEDFEFTGSLTGAIAKERVEEMSIRMTRERAQIGHQVPEKYLPMDAGDIVLIRAKDDGSLSQPHRIQQVQYGVNGLIKWSLVPMRQGVVSVATVTTAGSIITSTVPIRGDTFGVLMDIPLFRATDTDDFGYYAAAGGGSDWRAGELWRDEDADTVYTKVTNFSLPQVIGETLNALDYTDSLHAGIDRRSRLTFFLAGVGVLSSSVRADLFKNKNVAAVQNPSGDWEIIAFQNATQVSDDTWEVDTLLRGRNGTEYAMQGHAADQPIVFLTAGQTLSLPQQQVFDGQSINYKFVTLNAGPDSATAVPFTNNNERLRPRDVKYLAGVKRASDYDLTWTRRGHNVVMGYWFNSVALPVHPIDGREYQVIVYSDSSFATEVNTYTVTDAEAFTYTSAQQTADFGSAQSTVYVGVVQMSSRVGRGRETQGTFS